MEKRTWKRENIKSGYIKGIFLLTIKTAFAIKYIIYVPGARGFFSFQKVFRKFAQTVALNPVGRDVPDFKNHIQKS